MSDWSRRRFVAGSLGVTAGAFLLPGHVNAKQRRSIYEGGLVTGQPEPMSYQSIPGFLSEEQLTPHYNAHYGGALRGYIAADLKLQTSITEGVEIEASAYGALQRARTNKANSVVLHELYFDGMTVNPSSPGEELQTAINSRFGSAEKWADDFQASARAATGWAILAFDPLNGLLYNVVSDKHATGVLWMATPLVVIDVYEHAFYVDYRNNKSAYIERFMEHIDWEEAGRRFGGIG